MVGPSRGPENEGGREKQTSKSFLVRCPSTRGPDEERHCVTSLPRRTHPLTRGSHLVLVRAPCGRPCSPASQMASWRRWAQPYLAVTLPTGAITWCPTPALEFEGSAPGPRPSIPSCTLAGVDREESTRTQQSQTQEALRPGRQGGGLGGSPFHRHPAASADRLCLRCFSQWPATRNTTCQGAVHPGPHLPDCRVVLGEQHARPRSRPPRDGPCAPVLIP